MTSRALARTVLLVLLAVTLAGCIVVSETSTSPRPRPAPAPPPPPSRPAVFVDLGFFYDALDPFGDWLWIEPYGWVWAPNDVRPFWRPYTVGRWVWSDWGWTWVSGERWGWATYHYGRWARVKRHGWVWIPGRDWGPAWVAWRHGGGVVGWAPLPPEVRFRAEIGLDFGGVDINVVIRQDWWCFVEMGRFVEPDIARYAYPVGRNATVIHKTKDATKVRVVDRRVINEGVELRDVERLTRRAVPVRRVVDAGDRDDRSTRIVGSEIRAYRPEVREAKPDAAPRRGRRPAEAAEQSRPAAPARPGPVVEAERRWDGRWVEDWRKLERKQDADDRKVASEPSQDRKAVLERQREENYEAAENAARELEAARARAKRRAERAEKERGAKPAGGKGPGKGRSGGKDEGGDK